MDITSIILTGLISIVFGVYLEKFKNKLIVLKYNVFFNPLGTTTKDEYWGDIEILYKGRKIQHLNYVTIEIFNDSNVDLDNVKVDIGVYGNSNILGSEAFYVDNVANISLDKEYFELLTKTIKDNEIDITKKAENPFHITPPELDIVNNYLLHNKKFSLPVLNRKTSIKIYLLIENNISQNPEVSVNVLHKSVKLVTEMEKAEAERRLGINVIISGIVVIIITTLLLLYYYEEGLIPLLILGVISVFNYVIGALLFFIIRFIKNNIEILFK